MEHRKKHWHTESLKYYRENRIYINKYNLHGNKKKRKKLLDKAFKISDPKGKTGSIIRCCKCHTRLYKFDARYMLPLYNEKHEYICSNCGKKSNNDLLRKRSIAIEAGFEQFEHSYPHILETVNL